MDNHQNTQSPQEILRMDLESLYIGNLNTVDSDLHLPERGEYGSSFTWGTGESRFIAPDGKVHRPLHGMGNREVELTVTARYGDCEAERRFTATVVQEEKDTVIEEVYPVALALAPGERAELPSAVVARCADGRLITRPVRWEDWTPLTEAGTLEVPGHVADAAEPVRAVLTFGAAEERRGPRRRASYFPMNQVRLLPGTVYYDNQQRMLEYLLSVDDGQMLYNFRKASGLSTQGAEPMTGWDADSCKLKGHTTGHYLSGLALAYAATGDQRFRKKIDCMVEGLAQCQEAFAAGGQCAPGFLSAYSEEQFDLLEKFTKYPEIWAPYYTLDKIMAGLYDCHTLAGNARARDVLDQMGDWVYRRLSRLTRETRDAMWAMYIAGEYGGMLGTMVKLYRLTGKSEHLEAARFFLNDKLFYPMSQGLDTLEDMHANQHIPQILGAMDLYQATGEEVYWRIASRFWEIAVGRHSYCIGGVGETEMFHAAGSTCRYLTDKAAESCASYNLLRLTGELVPYTMNGAMLDYYENTLCNHIMTSCSHSGDGGTTYFMPLGPGGMKEYSTAENTCCHGTGMESRFRYMEHIFMEDDAFLYVNLLVDAALSGESALEVRTLEPGVVEILAPAGTKKGLKIHIPAWGREKLAVQVNGQPLEALRLEDGFLVLPDTLGPGGQIVLRLPMELRQLENNSDRRYFNLAWGPYILAALDKRRTFFTAASLGKVEKERDGLSFRAGNVKLKPFPLVDQEAYHVYFRKD